MQLISWHNYARHRGELFLGLLEGLHMCNLSSYFTLICLLNCKYTNKQLLLNNDARKNQSSFTA